MTGQDAPF